MDNKKERIEYAIDGLKSTVELIDNIDGLLAELEIESNATAFMDISVDELLKVFREQLKQGD